MEIHFDAAKGPGAQTATRHGMRPRSNTRVRRENVTPFRTNQSLWNR